MVIKKYLTCQITLILFFLAFQTTAQFGGDLEGQIECTNGSPIVGAIVTLGEPYIDTTDIAGHFSIEDIPAGYYMLNIILEGYFYSPTGIIIEAGSSTVMDGIIPCGDFIVAPLNINVTLDPNAQTTETITLSHSGGLSLEWSAEVEIFPPCDDKDFLDVIFQFPITGDEGKTGIECDGGNIYVTNTITGIISKYGMDGTYIGDLSLVIPGIQDLTFNGTYFYGGNGSTTIFEMDFYTPALVSTINAPGNVRAIAYNEDADLFYGYSWGGDIIMFDQAGTMVGSAPIGPSGVTFSGFAYDNVSDSSPYLWGYGQALNDSNILVQIDAATLLETGFVVDLGAILPFPLTNVSGGLYIQPGFISSIVTIGGLVMDEWIWGLELAEVPPPWISINPVSGTIAPGETVEMIVDFDATEVLPWTFEAEIQFSTLPNVGSPVVSVSMTIDGAVSPPYNLESSINCVTVDLNWTYSNPMCPPEHFNIYRNNELIGNATEKHYSDSTAYPEINYEYTVTAFFTFGETFTSNPVDVLIPSPDGLEPTNLSATSINGNILCLAWETYACLEPETYNLYRDAELLAVLTEPYYCDTLFTPGFYEYFITASYYFGESGSSNTYFFFLIDIDNTTVENTISIFPNPVNDKLLIKSLVIIKQFEFFTIQGLPVLSGHSEFKEISLDVSDLEAGIYFLKVKTDKAVSLRKVIVR